MRSVDWGLFNALISAINSSMIRYFRNIVLSAVSQIEIAYSRNSTETKVIKETHADLLHVKITSDVTNQFVTN